MFEHFLITRFNLRGFKYDVNSNGDKNVEWTKKHIELFERYCFPSIWAQNNKNFRWIIYFDAFTANEHFEFINRIKRYEFITVYYEKSLTDFENHYINHIKNLATEDWVIISEINTENCLHINAIDAIQRNFVKQDEFMISLASGYVLDISKRIMSHYYCSLSPLISIIENMGKEKFKGIFYRPHSSWNALKFSLYKELFFKNQKSKFLFDQSYWIQLVDGKNVANSFYRGFPVIKSRNLVNFWITFKNKPQLLPNMIKYVNYAHWKDYIKVSIVKLFN